MRYNNLLNPSGDPVQDGVGGNLQQKFGLPPFSVFDARSGEWQRRKEAWLALGIQSELGRGQNLLRFSDTVLEPDPKKRAAANSVSSFRDQDKLGAIMRDKKKGASAIPGGGTGKNSAWKFRTTDGYATQNEIAERLITPGRGRLGNGRGSAYATMRTRQETSSNIEPQTAASASGTSIFDPVLCEMFYRWFVPRGGVILDPFAGGSVRGIVAGRLGYDYFGVDLREEQLVANRDQAKRLCRTHTPQWQAGNSRRLFIWFDEEGADGVWSCPPYFDLERYSDDPEDLSNNKTYDGFLMDYDTIIGNCAKALKNNRFAGWVIGEVRDKHGFCRGLVSDTIYLFEKAGLHLYNDAILLTAVGSLPIRAGRIFGANRKLGRTHQHVLIFVKGDPEKAVEAIGDEY